MGTVLGAAVSLTLTNEIVLEHAYLRIGFGAALAAAGASAFPTLDQNHFYELEELESDAVLLNVGDTARSNFRRFGGEHFGGEQKKAFSLYMAVLRRTECNRAGT